jgi:sugar (pentulose or hexulose) kinase
MMRVALDLGSTSVKAVAMDADANIVLQLNQPVRGQLDQTLDLVLRQLCESLPADSCRRP